MTTILVYVDSLKNIIKGSLKSFETQTSYNIKNNVIYIYTIHGNKRHIYNKKLISLAISFATKSSIQLAELFYSKLTPKGHIVSPQQEREQFVTWALLGSLGYF